MEFNPTIRLFLDRFSLDGGLRRSAFVLDIIAASALVVFATRVGFGYKQVWDRYQVQSSYLRSSPKQKGLIGGRLLPLPDSAIALDF